MYNWTKSITDPQVLDGLASVSSRAILSQATSFNIDIPQFSDDNGPIRY